MRVAITASSGRLHGLEERLRALGHDPIRSPLIKVRPRTDEASRVAAAALEPLRWRLYPSRTAVEAWRALGLGFDPDTRIGAVGPATAAALRAAGAHVDLVARPATAAALAAQVLAHPDGPRHGETVGVVQGSGARPSLARGLRAGRVDVRIAIVYDREGLGWRVEAPVDAIVVASPSGVTALPAAVGSVALIVAIGPTTAAAARRRGWRVVVAAAPTAEAVTAALVREPVARLAAAGRRSDGSAP